MKEKELNQIYHDSSITIPFLLICTVIAVGFALITNWIFS